MPSITQTIPNFFGGISKVPDSQMGRGQVKDAVNCIPDLNKGLYKRPGAKRVGTSVLANATSTGVWFHYYRDETEGSYIGQVQTNGAVNMWDGETGNAITVNYESGQQTNLQNYLSNGTIGSETLQFTTINDSTFVVNRNVTAAMQPTSVSKTDERPHTYSAFVELKVVQNGRQYGLNVHDPTSNATTAISTATQIAANPTGAGFGSFPGATGHCPHTGTKLFTLNSGTTKKILYSVSQLLDSRGGCLVLMMTIPKQRTSLALIHTVWIFSMVERAGLSAVQALSQWKEQAILLLLKK